MPSPFQTEQVTLAQLFSGARVFAFPTYQRPYRWTIEEAMTLLDDISSACQRKDPGYFLGNVVLTRESDRSFLVIDGRQRLTTLFILICMLRDLEEDKGRKRGLHRLVYDETNVIARADAGWRLQFSPGEIPLIESFIAKPGALEKQLASKAERPERLQAMLDVAEEYRNLLSQPPSVSGLPRREDLTDYLLHQCEVIVLTASSTTSGLRLFQVLNNRGLQLSEGDLVKPDLLQALEAERRDDAAQIWDEVESKLGTENLDILLRSYIFIQSGDWIPPGRSFTEPLKAVMMSRGADTFHFQDLPKYGEALARIHWLDIPRLDAKRNPNTLIAGLKFLGRGANEWKEFLPVSLEILIRFAADPEEMYRHFEALDRIFYVWFINEVSEGPRRRMAWKMIEAIRAGTALSDPDSPFNVPDIELKKALARLQRPFPKLFQRGALIRRVELAMCQATGKPMPQYLDYTTAEHILPKNPPQKSRWTKSFSSGEQRECLDLLGNIIPLSRELYRRVSNKEFDQKKAAYKKAGADRYFLSVGDACTYLDWTPETIRTRTRDIAELMTLHWARKREKAPTKPAE
ncbi:DUF262 domain-containing protein [Ponticaulis profundi]|uniref:DUF262 domain-containing protein n=1 Tax=Ponticaulis profundi TaxID=2665222 RepID=A0ABW1S5S2_9PROT